MTTTLETLNVTKIFGGLIAVDHVDLVVPKQSIASIIGPNGAGKTTFFNCITGFYIPEEGDIVFNGSTSITGMAPASSPATFLPATWARKWCTWARTKGGALRPTRW